MRTMWTAEDDVVLSAVTYYIGSKTNNKTTSLVNPKCHSDQPQFQLAEGDFYSNNCGQIFITINRVLVFHCTFCKNKYGTLFNFLQHIAAEHILGQKESKISEKNATKGNDANVTPITKVEPVHRNLSSLKVASKIIVDNESTNKIIQRIPEIKEKLPRQNERNEEMSELEKTSDEELGDIDSVKGCQDKMGKSSLVFEEPATNTKSYKKSYKKIKNTIKCDKCDKIFSNIAVLKSHLVSHSAARDYSCSLCPRTFKHKCNLSQHIIRHTSEKKYKCELCDKLFFTQIETTIHQRTHAEDRPHVCFKCGDAFKSASNLFQHIRRRHDNIRSAKCDICEMTFFDRSQLKLHMVVHSSERPFLCTYCSSSFKRRYHLQQHIKSHLKTKKNGCNFCDKSFNLKHSLKAHIKINHNILECSPINE